MLTERERASEREGEEEEEEEEGLLTSNEWMSVGRHNSLSRSAAEQEKEEREEERIFKAQEKEGFSKLAK